MRLSSVLGNWNIRKWNRPCQAKKKNPHRTVFPKILSGLVPSQTLLEIACLQKWGEKEMLLNVSPITAILVILSVFLLLFFVHARFDNLKIHLQHLSYSCSKESGEPEAPINSPPDNVLSCATLKPHYRNDLQIFIYFMLQCSGLQPHLQQYMHSSPASWLLDNNQKNIYF